MSPPALEKRNSIFLRRTRHGRLKEYMEVRGYADAARSSMAMGAPEGCSSI
jgi:hypothetical protein